MTLPTGTLHERARTGRVRLGLSQEQLGQIMRRPQRTICRWENGRSKPTPSGASDLAQALCVSLRWLLTGEGPTEATKTGKTPVAPEVSVPSSSAC